MSLETAKSIMKTQVTEKRLLSHSLILSILFSVIGVGAGLYTRSQMIMFDGLYSLLSVVLSYLSLASARFMSKNDWKKFPFGKSIVEPLVIIVKYSAILIMLGASVIGAVYAILTGGRPVDKDMALFYAVFSSLACLIMYLHLRRQSKKQHSGLLSAESSQWLFDTYASFGVLVTFILVYVLDYFNVYPAYLNYIDPLIVLVTAASFAKVPFVSIRMAMKEVLGVSPEGELARNLDAMTKEMERKYKMKESFLRVTKRRKLLRVEIDFIVDEHSLVQTIKQQDAVREELEKKLHSIKTDKWITVAFTSNRKYAL